MDRTKLSPGCVVVIDAFDDIPEHLFQIDEVLEDCVTGFALSGPLTGEYRGKTASVRSAWLAAPLARACTASSALPTMGTLRTDESVLRPLIPFGRMMICGTS